MLLGGDVLNRLDASESAGRVRTFRISMKFLNVQGLRAVAVLLVVMAHFHLLSTRLKIPPILDSMIPLGNWGVDLFFVISGFIMITVHWSDFGAANGSKRFLIRRVVRIIPNYWLVTLFMFAIITLAPSMLHHWPTHANIIPSLLLFPDKNGTILFQAWTLIYEMYFYYVFTALLNFPRRVALAGMGIWAMLIFAAQFFPVDSNIFWHYYLSNIILEFLVGVVAGVLIINRLFVAPIASIALGIIAVGLALAYALHFNTTPWLGGNYRWAFVGIPMALILYGSVQLEKIGNRTFPTFMLHTGDASYSIYLWHMILYVVASKALLVVARHVNIPTPILLVVIPALVVSAGILLYRYVEVPLLRFSQRLASRLFPTLLPAERRRESLQKAEIAGQFMPAAAESQVHN